MIKRTSNGVIIVSDDITIDMSRIKSELKDQFINKVHDFEQTGRVGVPPKLVASVAATHAGLPTGNMAFYTPDRMKQGLPSFTSDFAKPVLLHHNDMKDPVGRVYRATYKDLSHLYVEPMKKFSERYGGTVFTDAKVDLEKAFDQVDWIVENMVPMKDYVGLGYGELDLHITDSEAAEKIMDQRYLTVSVGFTTDSMYCSNCHQDWASEGFCEHERGKTYDGKQTLLIPGKFNYEEVSWVNNPADAGATVLSISETPSLLDDADTTEVLEAVSNTQDSMCEPILISVADGKVSRLDSFKRVTPTRAQEIIDVAKKQDDKIQPKAPELIKATIEDKEVEFPIEASDLLQTDDTKREHYITDETDGHRHRVIIDPETGNGYTSYDTDHSHPVINRLLENGGHEEYNNTTEKYEVKTPHTHELDKKVSPLTDEKDDVTETPEGEPTEDDVTEVEDAKKKKKYKKISDDVEGEDEIELEDGADIPEGYELIEDAKEVEADPREAIKNNDDLTDSQKARKLFELSQSQEKDNDAPTEFDVVEIDLIDPTNADSKITLAFTSEDGFRDSLSAMTPEAIEANKDQLETACAVFGMELPKVEDATGTPLTKAEAAAAAANLFENINKEFVDNLIQGLNGIVDDDERKEIAAHIVDRMIADEMFIDIFTEYNLLKKELEDTRTKLAAVTRANRDFYAGKQDDLARVVVALKVALKKPEFVDLNEEALGTKTKEYKVRSVDSLQDSLNDLINEFSDTQIEEETNEVSETPVEPEIGKIVNKDSANRQDMEIFENMGDNEYALARSLQNRFRTRS